MDRPTKIFFVTWPNGNVLEGSQTSVSENHATGVAIRSFLPEQWFPGLKLSERYLSPIGELWKAMERAGFKVHELELPKEVADGVSY